MTALNVFVEQNIPNDLRHGRSFTGPRGWVHLMNQLLRRIESEGLVRLTQKRECGVEVFEDYWITPPRDFRRAISVYYPPLHDHAKSDRIYNYEVVNGKIKLREPFLRKTTVFEVDLLESDDERVVVANGSVTADQFNKNILVLQDGEYAGDTILIGRHGASDPVTGEAFVPFLHKRNTGYLGSSVGYFTDVYLVLRYMATFTGLTAHDDEIPVDPRFDTCLIAGLCYLAKQIGSADRREYREEFEYELDVLGGEEFTPSPDQARAEPRPMAAFEDCSGFNQKHSEFHGEFE